MSLGDGFHFAYICIPPPHHPPHKPFELNQTNMQMQREPRLWRRCLLSSLQAVPHCGTSTEPGWQQHLDASGLGGREGGKGGGTRCRCRDEGVCVCEIGGCSVVTFFKRRSVNYILQHSAFSCTEISIRWLLLLSFFGRLQIKKSSTLARLQLWACPALVSLTAEFDLMSRPQHCLTLINCLLCW